MAHSAIDSTATTRSPRSNLDVATVPARPAHHRTAAERVAAWREARRQRRWGWLLRALAWFRTWLHISR